MSRGLIIPDIGVLVQPALGTSESIYLENTEWTASTDAPINLASGTDPSQGAVSCETTADMGASKFLKFEKGSNAGFGNGSLTFDFQCKVAMNVAAGQLDLQFYHNGSAVGSVVNFLGGPGSFFGVDGGVTGSYQTATIPMSNFAIPAGQPVDEFRISSGAGPSTRQFFIDNINGVAEAFTDVITLSFGGNQAEFVQTNSTTYNRVAAFIFPGTNLLGSISQVSANFWRNATATSVDIRLYDATNAQQICEVTGVTSLSDLNIIDMGAIANLPTSEALIEVQIACTGGGRGRRGICGAITLRR